MVDELLLSGLKLKVNQVFSYAVLPILGGNYDSENIYTLDIYEHYSICGEIHFKLKDLPDGPEVRIAVKI